jgi:primosomal protein N' (replication factor Y)
VAINKIIIQTRIKENKTLQYILSGNILPLCREDLLERKNFGYPPFKRLIKITFEGNAPDTEKARILIEQILGNYEPQIFSAFIGKIRGQYITNTVIKVDPKIWPLPINEKNILDENSLCCVIPLIDPSYSPEMKARLDAEYSNYFVTIPQEGPILI